MNDKNFQDKGVSPRALTIAKMIDRLPPGRYGIELFRPASPTERWEVTITQSTVVTVRKAALGQKDEPASP
jgi:hypothetical protein